ncbi:enoyl-CoA hydratase-related protein [Caulobacter sp. S45]|uniref:enoyl-CoA hydratase-related protein n=1 Tax=Caulobacter sp. S45 TaxID=1641861 RepID=UPI00131D57AD|nr:enoyl-CoA hydratase-related protein [Caulobacter sp. S45]
MSPAFQTSAKEKSVMSEPITHPYVDVQDELPDPGVQLEATRDGVAVVMLNRPQRGNALGRTDIAALTEAFTTLQGAEGVRIVFLRGAGDTFSMGADPGEMRATLDTVEEDIRLYALDVAHMLQALRAIPALTVALVDGSATSLGAALVAACDMAAATERAVFAFPDVRMGLSPGPLVPFVVEAVGARAARRLFASGASIDAVEALRIGLIDRLVPDARGLEGVLDGLATDIMASAPVAMDEAKRLVAHVVGQPIERPLIEETARRFARHAVGPEAHEGLNALMSGARPVWAG